MLQRVVRPAIMAIAGFVLVACSSGTDDRSQRDLVTPSAQEESPPPPNFVILLTDDQRADSLWAMPILQEKLSSRGVKFTEAFATNPECCPFRASMIAGGYQSHNTGVLRNSRINGTSARLNEANTLATQLDHAGYRTGFVGRYMHGYNAGHVPPGWDFLVANAYYGYDSYHELRGVTFAEKDETGKAIIDYADVQQYVTDFHADETIRFLRTVQEGEPFFIWTGFFAPHGPLFPDHQDLGTFNDYNLPKTDAHTEDLSDKPAWLQRAAAEYLASPGSQVFCTQTLPRRQLEMLQSVDRAVGRIVDEVEAMGQLDNTVFIFTSDNGLTYGEHSVQCEKGMAYEESIKVPFVVIAPNVLPREENALVAANLDIGATIHDLAGLAYQGDGDSLAMLLNNPSTPWRDHLFIENFGYLQWRLPDSPIWAGIRTERYKYVEHSSGEVELYDLLTDPMELASLHGDPEQAQLLAELSAMTNEKKGLAIVEHVAPPIALGVPYAFQQTTHGGTAPFTWSVFGDLPPGLTLDQDTGLISGMPTEIGTFQVRVTVAGSRLMTHALKPESFRRDYTFDVVMTN